ncbi:MAG TPA: MBL fold metallo-hydrolase [Dehalococcoidia bacterium]|nr:MBL fold metallo-hydrolase [Dehalococcoidia bacterium]
METPRTLTNDITILPSFLPLPGFGVLPINAFLLKSHEPVLVDTGTRADSPEFMRALESAIDPEDIRWLYLTHPDADHIGSLKTVLDRAPNARLVTTYLGYGALSLTADVPLDRVYLLNPGESLDVGDRTLTVLRPPTFDNPATTAFWESKTGTLFSSDCFGALLQAPAEDARDVAEDELRQGQVMWATVDSPWLHNIDRSAFAAELHLIRQMAPDLVLSAHLPPARSMMPRILQTLSSVPESTPFVGPNQAALEAMLAQMVGAPA